MIVAMRRAGTGPKTTLNAITPLHQVFEHGQRRGWCAGNPCTRVDRPRLEEDNDIRYLSPEEVEALLRAVPEDDEFGPTDRALYLAAVASGLRQGELLGLRWRDIDWDAGRIRVRRNYVRGHWGTPKSRRSTRAVPMIDRLAGELDRHYKRSHYQADDDLVFLTPRPERCSPTRTWSAASSARATRPGSGRCASTISGIRTPCGWLPPGYRCERSRSGSATATTRRRFAMRTTRLPPMRARWPSGRSRGQFRGRTERN
jgi:integrase